MLRGYKLERAGNSFVVYSTVVAETRYGLWMVTTN
jgi:hypothetical protein